MLPLAIRKSNTTDIYTSEPILIVIGLNQVTQLYMISRDNNVTRQTRFKYRLKGTQQLIFFSHAAFFL